MCRLLSISFLQVIILFFQVVTGVLVRLTLELGYSTCRKGQDIDIATCQLKEDSVMMMMI